MCHRFDYDHRPTRNDIAAPRHKRDVRSHDTPPTLHPTLWHRGRVTVIVLPPTSPLPPPPAVDVKNVLVPHDESTAEARSPR
mmetsp:Transcript_49957/g.60345  ORF Transcript_49957/g.60345 Transcript_49957/m.60345 type:complete len:82 (-) Transcript_49957:240-485(-)